MVVRYVIQGLAGREMTIKQAREEVEDNRKRQEEKKKVVDDKLRE